MAGELARGLQGNWIPTPHAHPRASPGSAYKATQGASTSSQASWDGAPPAPTVAGGKDPILVLGRVGLQFCQQP